MKAIRDFSRSSSFSLSALFTALLMLGVFFIAYFIVISSDQTLIRESEAAIDVDAKGIQEIYYLAGIEGVTETLRMRVQDATNSSFYAIQNQEGQMLVGNLSNWPSEIEEIRDDGLVVFNIDSSYVANIPSAIHSKAENYNVLGRTLVFDARYQLFIGRKIDDLEIAQWVGRTFGWFIVFVLCLIAGCSLWVGYYVVSRINDISETADRIMNTGDLSARLPVESTWDDLSSLAVSLNRMLSEIEYSVNNIKSVSDNIAHDLRTPLTRLRQRIENQFDEETARPLLNEADNLLDMFNGLLRIADIEADKKRCAFKPNDVNQIVDDVVEMYQPLADGKNIRIAADIKPLSAICDKDLIFQSVANIIDNAIKFTPENGLIQLYCGYANGEVIIRVNDSGIGIDAEKHNEITQRFFRDESSRTTKGNGLGMAMVAAIVKLHRGKLSFASNPLHTGSGLGVSLYLPASL